MLPWVQCTINLIRHQILHHASSDKAFTSIMFQRPNVLTKLNTSTLLRNINFKLSNSDKCDTSHRVVVMGFQCPLVDKCDASIYVQIRYWQEIVCERPGSITK